MAPLPLFKLFMVLFKEISKPIATRIKHQAQEHQKFRGYTIRIGRLWEGITQRAEVWTRGGRVKELKPISESHALTVGADFMSQSFMLSTSLTLVLFEWYRSTQASNAAAEMKKKEKAIRAAAKEARLAAIEHRLAELALQLDALPSSSPHAAGQGLLSHFMGRALTRTPAAAASAIANVDTTTAAANAASQSDKSVAKTSWAGEKERVSDSAKAATLLNVSATSVESKNATAPAAVSASELSAEILSDSERDYLAQVEARLHHAQQTLDTLTAEAEAAKAASKAKRGWFSWLWGSGGSEPATSSGVSAAAITASTNLTEATAVHVAPSAAVPLR